MQLHPEKDLKNVVTAPGDGRRMSQGSLFENGQMYTRTDAKQHVTDIKAAPPCSDSRFDNVAQRRVVGNSLWRKVRLGSLRHFAGDEGAEEVWVCCKPPDYTHQSSDYKSECGPHGTAPKDNWSRNQLTDVPQLGDLCPTVKA